MSDLDPIPFPARIVRARFEADRAAERASLLVDLAWEKFVAGTFASVIALDKLGDGEALPAALWLVIALASAGWAAHTLRRRNSARRRAEALSEIGMEYARTRTVQPWPQGTP